MDHTEQVRALEYENSRMHSHIVSMRAQKSHRSRWINEAKAAIANAASFSFNPVWVAEHIADYTETISRNEKAIAVLNSDIARWTGEIANNNAVIASALADEVSK